MSNKHRHKESKPKIQWQPIVEIIIVMMTILGSTIPLYMHTDSKLTEALSKSDLKIEAAMAKSDIKIENAMSKSELSLAAAMSKIDDTLQGIREDMRDFHGRLCAIEERNRK